ncbi:MAG TPA: helix-turn-helix domain-containing protein [Candidatus Dormibacteraeota bacterium]
MGSVKPRRPYASALRIEQARQTRARMLDAAELVFADRGYASSTIEAIASEAGVAVDTVYAGFSSKRGLLSALMDVRVGGDDEPIDLLDRSGPQGVRRERNQKHQIYAFAKDITPIIERARPVDDIMRGAAAVDSEIAALRARIQEQRFLNIAKFVSWVTANGPLRGDMSEEAASAIVWSLTSPEMHRLLRVDRGWTMERYTEWLADTLTLTLLP